MTTLSADIPRSASNAPLRARLGALSARFAAWRLRAAMTRELGHLSDHMLRDIGFSRDEVASAVRRAGRDAACRLRPGY